MLVTCFFQKKHNSYQDIPPNEVSPHIQASLSLPHFELLQCLFDTASVKMRTCQALHHAAAMPEL